jgi:hypothetical protein
MPAKFPCTNYFQEESMRGWIIAAAGIAMILSSAAGGEQDVPSLIL